MLGFVAAPFEKMAEVINRTRKEAKAKISKVCCKCVTAVCVQVTDYMVSNLNEKIFRGFVVQIKFERGRLDNCTVCTSTICT